MCKSSAYTQSWVFAVAATALLAAAGCGSSGGGGGDHPTGGPTGAATSATSAAPVRDKGPECLGTSPADGVHVLRGGGFRLPGGGGVQYVTGTSDGSGRTATLRDGATYQKAQSSRTVLAGQKITLDGHPYTVDQICTFRVVLSPGSAADKTALAAAPAAMKPVGGDADDGLCFTTNAAVRAAAANGFPAKGANWTLANNGGRMSLPTGLSVALYSVDTAAGTAVIGANCAGIGVASYKDATVGDTLEFAGVLFKVTSLDHGTAVLNRTS